MTPSQKYFTGALALGFLINLIAYGIIVPTYYSDITKLLATDFIILLTMVDLFLTPILVFEIFSIQRKKAYFVLGLVWATGMSPYIVHFLF